MSIRHFVFRENGLTVLEQYAKVESGASTEAMLLIQGKLHILAEEGQLSDAALSLLLEVPVEGVCEGNA